MVRCEGIFGGSVYNLFSLEIWRVGIRLRRYKVEL